MSRSKKFSITKDIQSGIKNATSAYLKGHEKFVEASDAAKAIREEGEPHFITAFALYAPIHHEVGLDSGVRKEARGKALKEGLAEAGLSEKQIKVLHENTNKWNRHPAVRAFLKGDFSEANQRAAFEQVPVSLGAKPIRTRGELLRFVDNSDPVLRAIKQIARIEFDKTQKEITSERVAEIAASLVDVSKAVVAKAAEKAEEKAEKDAAKEAAKAEKLAA